MTDHPVPEPIARLTAAATHLRDLATRAATTLKRNELQWTDLTVSDTAYRATNSPMVWSQYAAALHPGAGAALADWLDRVARGWDALIKAAEQVLDPHDPKQVDAATILNSGPYDAQEALALADAILTGGDQ